MGRRTLLLIASILVAALGTSLIWLYVQGADARAASTEAEVPVLVASNAVTAGSPAASVQTQSKMMPKSLVEGLPLVTAAADLKGFTRTDVVPGLPLLKTQFGGTAPTAAPVVQGLGPKQVAMQVTLSDPQRLVGLLQPGSHIRVYAALVDPKDSSKKSAGVLFNDVTVLLSGPAAAAPAPAPGTAAAPANGATTVPTAIVTLALSNDQAKSLVYAQIAGGAGSLYFGLLGSNQVGKDTGGPVGSIQSGEM